jgi:hypothetical protein
MMTALARQELSRTEQAGLLAGAALAVAAERMGGRPPDPFLEGEEALRAETIREVRRRLKIAPDDRSDEALRAIEDTLDAEMEEMAEPVDIEAALARAAALVARTAQAAGVRALDAGARPPSLFERVTATFRRQRSERPGERDPAVAEEDPETEQRIRVIRKTHLRKVEAEQDPEKANPLGMARIGRKALSEAFGSAGFRISG